MSKFLKISLLIIIIGIGFFLRIHNLGMESLWLDEGYTLNCAENIERTLEEGSSAHPPLYFILTHYWIKAFGNSEFALRLLPLIFGVLAILLIYFLAKEIFNSRTGLISSLLLAVSFFNIEYSQEARMYSLLVFLTLLSFLFFTKLVINKKYNFRNYLFYALSTLALLYTHYFGVLILMVQVIYFIWLSFHEKKEINLRKWAFIIGGLIILIVPWAPHLLADIGGNLGDDTWRVQPTLKSLVQLLLHFSSESGILVAVFSLLGLYSLFRVKKKDSYQFNVKLKNVEKNFLLLFWFLLPVAVAYVISKAVNPSFIPRYFIHCSPAFFILAAKGLDKLAKKHLIISGLILIFIAGFSLSIWQGYINRPNVPQWGEISSEINTSADKEEDLVIFNRGGYKGNIFPYYFKEDLPALFLKYNQNKNKYTNIEEFRNKVETKERVWFIIRDINPNQEEKLRSILYKTHSLFEKENFNRVTVYTFVKRD